MAFFNQFPKRTYDLQRDGKEIVITDTFRNVDVNEKLIDTISAYQFYTIKDGERPDHVATKLYKNAGYYWSFFVVNDHLKKGYGSWPMSYTQFDDYMNENYRAYSIMELKQADFSKVSAISNFTSLSLGFEFDSPLGANESPNNILGTIHKIDTETNQVWIKNPSERLINSLDGKGNHTFKIFDTSDGDNFATTFVPRKGWGYGDNATAYYKDSSGKRIGIYDAIQNQALITSGFKIVDSEGTYAIRSGSTRAAVRASLPADSTTFRVDIGTSTEVNQAVAAGFVNGAKVLIFGLTTSAFDLALGATHNDPSESTLTVSTTGSGGGTIDISGYTTTIPVGAADGPSSTSVKASFDITDAYIILEETFNNFAGNPVTYREHEDEENEKLKSIRIVKPDQIGAFADLYKSLINE